MREARCPSCFALAGHILEESDFPVFAWEFGFSQDELERGVDGERSEEEPYTCKNCGTTFIPAEQPRVGS